MSGNVLRPCRDNPDKLYPVSDYYGLLNGFDIIRSNNKIVALVVVTEGSKESMRFYDWRKKGEDWKVELCRMDTRQFDWDSIRDGAKELKQKYGIMS